MTDLRYPIGPCPWGKSVLTTEERSAAAEKIAQTPGRLKAAVAGLTPEQFDTPYRHEGWTVRQVIHHLPDSHMNGYVRFKLALTESEPTIKPYDEKSWVALADSRDTPIEVSVTLLDALHTRWVILLRAMRSEDFGRRLNHPEHGILTLDEMLNTYAWHGAHHVAHIASLRERKGWR